MEYLQGALDRENLWSLNILSQNYKKKKKKGSSWGTIQLIFRMLLILPIHGENPSPPPVRATRLPKNCWGSSQAIADAGAHLTPGATNPAHFPSWFYLHRDENDFLPTRFSCVSRSTCSCGFFPPFLITFSDSKDIADGHQTVQNVNYDWVESEHKK